MKNVPALALTFVSLFCWEWTPAAETALHFDFDRLESDASKRLFFEDKQSGSKIFYSGKKNGPLLPKGASGQAIWFSGDPGESLILAEKNKGSFRETLSIRVWLWPLRYNEHQGIVFKGERSAVPEKTEYKLSIRPEGTIEFGFKGPRGDWAQLISSEPIPLRAWTLVTATFQRGEGRIFFGGKKMAQGEMRVQGRDKELEVVRELLPSEAPLLIGRMQKAGGAPDYPYFGVMDELSISSAMEAAPAVSPQDDPLKSLLIFEKEIAADQLAPTPYLTGQMAGKGGWFFEVSDPKHPEISILSPVETNSDGRFRMLLDDLCGRFDIGRPQKILARGYRRQFQDPINVSQVEWSAGPRTAQVSVDPEASFQTLGGFAAYANPPKSFLTDPAERKSVYGPILTELREAGISHLDFSFGSLSVVEPKNDNADPKNMDMDFFRSQFKANAEVQTLIAFIKYVRSEGFTFGIRSISFAPWQTQEGSHLTEEIAESWVAALRLLKEEGLLPTHLIPVWEPAYAPETVAKICASTAKLAREHGFELPVVGPYVIATGGQSTTPFAMPDKYENGARYTKAYLEACGDLAPVIGLEDYASGTPLIRPNLERLWKEIIEPMSVGKPRELWMIEYGAPSGMGPWNHFPSRWHGPLSTWDAAFRLAREMNQLLNGGVSRYFFWKAWDSIGEAKMATPSSWGLIKGQIHDEERRPPFYTGRMFWKFIPEGSKRIACTAEGDLAVNAVKNQKRISVFLINPRRETINARVSVKKTRLAPRALFYSCTEKIRFQETEIYGQGGESFDVELPPQSVNTLLVRIGSDGIAFDTTRWIEPDGKFHYLSGIEWISASTTKGTQLAWAENALHLNWRRDETLSGEWLVHEKVRYRYGLTAFGKAAITFSIPDGTARFETRLGIDDSSSEGSSANVKVLLDGQKALDCETARKGDKGQVLSLPVTGKKTLTLEVEPGQTIGTVDFLEARFVF